jgi:hypothetical protein
MPAARDEVGDRDPVRRDRALRQQAEAPRDLLGGDRADRRAVELDRARLRVQHAGERAQQRRLAAGVGPHDRGELALLDAHVEVLGHDVLVVREREVGGLQGRCLDVGHVRPLVRSVASSQAR